jgi:hypothetical protein
MNHFNWYSVYTAALLELNPAEIPKRIREAETAIFARAQDLAQVTDSSRERVAIADALFSLRALQRNPPRYPDFGPADCSLFNRM